MAMTDKMSRTISCDADGCTQTVTFDPQDIEAVTKLPEWLKKYRLVQRGDKQSFGYCSDVCEVKGITKGSHNTPEPQKVQPATEAQVAQAVANAKVADALKQTDEATEDAAAKTVTLA